MGYASSASFRAPAAWPSPAAAPRLAGPGEVTIDVHAAGLNFRDMMWAMGLLPEEALIDGFAGLWCVSVGHRRPEIIAAVEEQMRRLEYFTTFHGQSTPPAIDLAEDRKRFQVLLNNLGLKQPP